MPNNVFYTQPFWVQAGFLPTHVEADKQGRLCLLLVLRYSWTSCSHGNSCFGKLQERTSRCRGRYSMGQAWRTRIICVKRYICYFPFFLIKILSNSFQMFFWNGFISSVRSPLRVLFFNIFFLPDLLPVWRVQPIPTLVDPLIPTCPWRKTRRRLGVKPSARLSFSWKEPR